jgi:hypothetical protein
MPFSLPEMTLKRGAKVCLPSGQEFARRFGFPELPPDAITARPEHQDFFRQSGLSQRTPLWYYLLREAAVEAVYEPEPGGTGMRTVQKLGTIGGRILCRNNPPTPECRLQLHQARGQRLDPAGIYLRRSSQDRSGSIR